jgi:KaiC/GvpD/RAD55 family RecA-like ATPase
VASLAVTIVLDVFGVLSSEVLLLAIFFAVAAPILGRVLDRRHTDTEPPGEYPVEHLRRSTSGADSNTLGIQPPHLSEPYVGNTDKLAELNTRLMSGGKRKTVVVQTPRGTGGTSLVVRFCAERENVLYVSGVRSIDDMFEKVARATLDDLEGYPKDDAVTAGRMLLRREREYLIVLDDMDMPSVVREIYDRFARVRLVVVTSQRHLEWNEYDVMTLDRLSIEEATEIMLAVSRLPLSERAAARSLVADLDCEPLLVRRAAEYLRTTGTSVVHLSRWLAKDPVGACRAISGSDPERSIHRMFVARFDSAAQSRLAMEVLRVMSATGRAAIPESDIYGLWRGREREVEQALNTLAFHRLIRRVPGRNRERRLAINVHVGRVLNSPHPMDEHRLPADIQRARRIARPLVRKNDSLGD